MHHLRACGSPYIAKPVESEDLLVARPRRAPARSIASLGVARARRNTPYRWPLGAYLQAPSARPGRGTPHPDEARLRRRHYRRRVLLSGPSLREPRVARKRKPGEATAAGAGPRASSGGFLWLRGSFESLREPYSDPFRGTSLVPAFSQ